MFATLRRCCCKRCNSSLDKMASLVFRSVAKVSTSSLRLGLKEQKEEEKKNWGSV